jgi:hypothetical protein
LDSRSKQIRLVFRWRGHNLIRSSKVIRDVEGKREKLSSLSTELVDRLRNFINNSGAKDRLEYVLVTTKRLTPEEQEYLSNIRTLGRAKFGECFEVDSVSVETIYNKIAESDTVGPAKLSLRLSTTVASSGDILLIGATKLTSIFTFMQEYKSSLAI